MFCSCRISTDKRVARSLCYSRATCYALWLWLWRIVLCDYRQRYQQTPMNHALLYVPISPSSIFRCWSGERRVKLYGSEGNRKSGVILVMLKVWRWEMRSPPTLVLWYGILYVLQMKVKFGVDMPASWADEWSGISASFPIYSYGTIAYRVDHLDHSTCWHVNAIFNLHRKNV